MSDAKQSRQHLILRVLWMLLFLLVWQLAELLLLGVVLLQLVLRLINGLPSRALMDFGDGLSQYLAQIGRFGCFHSDEKPWPFADWPTPREPQGEGAEGLQAMVQPAASATPAAPAAAVATAGVAAAGELAPVADEPAAEASASDASDVAAAPLDSAAAPAGEVDSASPAKNPPAGADAEPRT